VQTGLVRTASIQTDHRGIERTAQQWKRFAIDARRAPYKTEARATPGTSPMHLPRTGL
jgi:hypothetical protein